MKQPPNQERLSRRNELIPNTPPRIQCNTFMAFKFACQLKRQFTANRMVLNSDIRPNITKNVTSANSGLDRGRNGDGG